MVSRAGPEGQAVGIVHDDRDRVLVGRDEPGDLLEDLLRQVHHVDHLAGLDRLFTIDLGRDGGRCGAGLVVGLGHLDQYVEEGLVALHPIGLRRNVVEGVDCDASQCQSQVGSGGRGEVLVLQRIGVDLSTDVGGQVNQRRVGGQCAGQVTVGAEGRDASVECAEAARRSRQCTLSGDGVVAVLVLGVETVRVTERVLGTGERSLSCDASRVGEDDDADDLRGVDDAVLAVLGNGLIADFHGGAASNVCAFAVADDGEASLGAGRGDFLHDGLRVGDARLHGVLVARQVGRVLDVDRGVGVGNHVAVVRSSHGLVDPVARVVTGHRCGQAGAVGLGQPLDALAWGVTASADGDAHHVVAGRCRDQLDGGLDTRFRRRPGCCYQHSGTECADRKRAERDAHTLRLATIHVFDPHHPRPNRSRLQLPVGYPAFRRSDGSRYKTLRLPSWT